MLGPVHGASAYMNRALGRFLPSPVRGTLLRRLTCTGGAHGPEPNHASQCSVPGLGTRMPPCYFPEGRARDADASTRSTRP